MTILAAVILGLAAYISTRMVDYPDMGFCIAIGWALAVVCYCCGREVRSIVGRDTRSNDREKQRV
jgi:hypothetical protein